MDEKVLNELVHTLELGGSSDNLHQQECTKRLQQLQSHPDFVLYLLYVFATDHFAETLRQRAGLFMKQFVKVGNVSTDNMEKVSKGGKHF